MVKISQNDKLGRFVVAAQPLKPGTIVFEELPFVVGPKPNTTAVCLECCAPIDGTEKGTKCQHCNWPMCDDCKLNSPRTHHAKECELFVQNKVKYQNLVTLAQVCLQMDCITPLRYLPLAQRKANKRLYALNLFLDFCCRKRRIPNAGRRKSRRWSITRKKERARSCGKPMK